MGKPRWRNARPSGEIPDWTSFRNDGGGEPHVDPLRAAQQVAGRPLRFADGLDALHSGDELAKYCMGLHSRELCPQAQMCTESKGEVFGRVSIHAEFVGVVEHLWVAIGR